MPKEVFLDHEEMRRELERLREENAELRRRLRLYVADPEPGYSKQSEQHPWLERSPLLTATSSTRDKVALYRDLFRGREDVYAVFWTNERTGKKGYSPAVENPWEVGIGKSKKYLPLTDKVIHDHLTGGNVIGCYPLLKDNTCRFLACDFDKEGWILDSLVFLDACREFGVPAYLERSRSGKGGHVWIFFASPVSAISARQLGMRLLRVTMDLRSDIDLGSYDRFFPNQDFVPAGGFGNLIALPLQRKSRNQGNTEFVNPEDPELCPYSDQWNFLSHTQRVTPAYLDDLLEKMPPLSVGFEAARSPSPSSRHKYPAPKQIRSIFGAALSLEKSGIPPWMVAQIKHVASFHNPKFYERQRLRLSNFQTPRLIKCYQEDISHIHLPRGILDAIREVIANSGSQLSVIDRCNQLDKLSFQFLGSLTLSQQKAVYALLSHELGVLVAPPGAGKTVMGCFMIAQRNLPTLILVHRKPILDQWRMQLMSLLGLATRDIGQIGGGRRRCNGIVDLAMIQSLTAISDLEDFFANYSFIIVDECHHLPAITFESCIKRAPARYFLGLTATPYRRDGLQDIITMQCGPIRFKLDDASTDLSLRLNVRETAFDFHTEQHSSIQDIFRNLVNDAERNTLVEADVIRALNQGRQCLVLTQWKEHCRSLADRMIQRGKAPFVLNGEIGKKKRSTILAAIENASPEKELLVIATGQYLGEGFDCPRIDTLFLTFPVSFKGKVVQYVGRTLRAHRGKNSVVVFDYSDPKVPILNRMHARRLKTYRAMGFRTEGVEVGDAKPFSDYRVKA